MAASANGPPQKPAEANEEAIRLPSFVLMLRSRRPDDNRPVMKPRPGLMMLTAVLAVLAWLLFGSPLHPTNFVLPSALASSKLDNTVFEAPEWATETPSVVSPDEIQLTLLETPPAPSERILPPPPPPEPVSEPAVEEPPPAEPAPEPKVEEPLPEPKLLPSDLPPGESPMSTPKDLTVKIILAGWFFGVPAYADEKKTDTPPPTTPQVADSILKLEKGVGDLSSQLANLKGMLDALAKQEDLLKLSLQVNKYGSDIEAVKKDIARLNDEVAQLKAKPAEPRVSSYPAPLPQPTASQIQLVNRWMEPMTVLVDGVSHRLMAGESKLIPKAAPSFNYEVFGVQAARTIAFEKPGETFKIEITPRPSVIP